jgi:cardiolipin synthase
MSVMTEGPRSALIWTAPNLVTFARLALIPLVCLLLALDNGTARFIAALLFAIAAATDWVDGWLARKYDQISPLGRMLDPIADKLLVALVLLMLAWDGTLGGWLIVPALAILFREIFISGLREYLGAEQIVVHVTPLAKWKTTIQLVAITMMILAPFGATIALLALIALWIAALITLVTGFEYMRGAWPHFSGEGE